MGILFGPGSASDTYYNNPDPAWKSGGWMGGAGANYQNAIAANQGGQWMDKLSGNNTGGPAGGGLSLPTLNPNVTNPVNPADIANANNLAGNSLDAQQRLIAALGTQNGINNQWMGYQQGQGALNALGANNYAGAQGAAMGGQGNLNAGLGGLNGAGAMGSAMGNQGALAGQLGGAGGVGTQMTGIQGLQNVLAQQQGIANGTGPNPAQAALNQATGANVANQAALMAGQRGAGANVGLMARQAAQQGAGIQQQAAGQGATMQAQQQLNALNAMGQGNQALVGAGAGLTAQQQAALGQQYGQGAGALGQLQTGLGQQYGQGTTGIQLGQGQQGINAGIAQNQVGNQLAGTTAGTQGALANQQNIYGAQGNYNSAMTSGQGSVNAGNTQLRNTQMQGNQGMIGGLMNAAGPVLGGLLGGAASSSEAGGAAGGTPTATDSAGTAVDTGMGYADGGDVDPNAPGPIATSTPAPVAPVAPIAGPQSSFGKFISDFTGKTDQDPNKIEKPDPGSYGGNTGAQKMQQGSQSLLKGLMAAKGGKVPAMVSEGEVEVPKKVVDSKNPVKESAKFVSKAMSGGGGLIKAKDGDEKAVKQGNSYDNDKIKKDLKPGEIIIPRNVMQSKDPVRGAADFVRKTLAKRKSA